MYGVFLLIALAYVLPDCWLYYSDSVGYGATVLHGRWNDMIHPHHMLLCPALWLFWKPIDALGLSATPLEVWRWIGVACSVGTLWVMLRILRATGFTALWATLGILTLGSCYFLWLFSTTPSHYTPTLLFLTIIFAELVRWEREPERMNEWGVMSAALFAAIAIHQIAVLILVPIVGWRWWITRREGLAFAPIPMLYQLLLVPVVAHIAASMLGTDSFNPLTMLKWLTSFGHSSVNWWWGELPPDQAPFSYWLKLLTVSHRELLWAEYISHFDDVRAAVAGHSPDWPIAVAWWGVINPIWHTLTAGILIVLGCWSIAATVILWRMGGAMRDYLVLALLWSIPFIGFHAFYRVQDGWFRLYYLLPFFWILMTPIALNPAKSWRRIGGSVWGLFLTFTLMNNIITGYGMWRHPESNLWRQDLAKLQGLDGWLVFNDWETAIIEINYALAYTDQLVFEGQLVDPADIPKEADRSLDSLPDYLYLESAFLKNQSANWQQTKVLHLRFRKADQGEPREVWIPMDRLVIDETVIGGVYRLVEARVVPAP